MVGCASALVFSPVAGAETKETVLHSFASGSDGADPAADLIQANGTLYGTTYGGGNYGYGTVFSVDPDSGAETVLHSFGNGTDGQVPADSLIEVNGTLYGTTSSGGTGCQGEDNCGAVFAIDLGTGDETVLYSFCSQQNCTDGAYPNAGLIMVHGVLVGTTSLGGNNNGGTVFALHPGTGAENVIYSFCSRQTCTDGKGPYASLIDVKGTLYGTTIYGGARSEGTGTVFALDRDTGAEQVLHAFCGRGKCTKDGGYPYNGVIDVDGTLYGTTYIGGTHDSGTVFALDPGTSKERVLYSFCNQPHCADGTNPYAGLIEAEGMLYGTATEYGGHEFGGAVFALDPTSGAETTLYSFCRQQYCTDGANPTGGLIDVKGTMFGTTAAGGSNGFGTVFALTGWKRQLLSAH